MIRFQCVGCNKSLNRVSNHVTRFSIILVCAAIVLGTPIVPTAPAADEPKKEIPKKVETERFLQFSEQGNVELQNTRGVIDVNGNFTIEAWVRWSRTKIKGNNILGDFSGPGTGAHLPVDKDCGFAFKTSAVENADERFLEFWIGHTPKGNTGWFVVKTRPVKGTDGNWQHIAVAKTPDVIRIFWNGKLAAEKGCKGLRFNGCPSDLYLGTRKGAKDGWGGGGLVGDIRAFRAYSKAVYTKSFTPDEVFGKFGKDLGEEILLDFTGEDKEQIDDLSGKKHHGLLNDVKWVQLRKLDNKKPD